MKSEDSKRYIPTSARVLAILQLCMVFTAIFWVMSIPFMGGLFEAKSKKIVFQAVMESPKYATLPEAEQRAIQQKYQAIYQQTESPFLIKLGKAFEILVIQLPLFERAWIALALVVSIMLLIRVEGALYAVWLLPVVALLYAVYNVSGGHPVKIADDAHLYPSEEKIVQEYLKEPLKSGIEEQRSQLLAGWHNYLIVEYAKESPSKEFVVYSDQVAQGEFAFNLERVKSFSAIKAAPDFNERKPLILILFYVLWNLFFAWFIYRKLKAEDNYGAERQ